MRRLTCALALAAFATMAWSSVRPTAAQTVPLGTVERITVHGRSLESNLIGDSADRAVFVYLPPGYSTNTAQRYPVVYLLHGYGLRAERWMSLFHIEALADQAITGAGGGIGTTTRVREMIIVNPDAYSFYDGSFYSNSPVTGDWETFIATDLVDYIDAHYRTLARRESRGLAGHSMGGYGTFRIAMKRPDVFGAMYALSACCAMDKGEPGEQMTAAGTYTTREQVAALRYPNKGTLARAAAWSPNADAPPLFVDLPVKDGVARPEIQAKWLANSIVPMLANYGDNLRQYRRIGLDVGTSDNLLETNKQIDAALSKAKIPHVFSTYPGDHNSRITERLELTVLPFFSDALAFD